MANIQQAAKWLDDGKKVRRASWGNEEFYLVLWDDRIEDPFDCLHTDWETEDFTAEDWEVLDG